MCLFYQYMWHHFCTVVSLLNFCSRHGLWNNRHPQIHVYIGIHSFYKKIKQEKFKFYFIILKILNKIIKLTCHRQMNTWPIRCCLPSNSFPMENKIWVRHIVRLPILAYILIRVKNAFATIATIFAIIHVAIFNHQINCFA